MINYTDQSSNQLHLYVIDGEPNIEQFEVIEKNTITGALGIINFGILSESHFVTLSGENLNLTEICACTTGTFQSKPLVNGELISLPTTITHNHEHWTYTLIQSKHSLYDTPTEIGDYDHVLTHVFPAGEHEGPDPVTIVGCTANDEQLLIESIHSYPSENIFVRTKSVFDFKHK